MEVPVEKPKPVRVKAFGKFWEVYMLSTLYASGNTCVYLLCADDESPFAKLSVNTEVDLPQGHFYLKAYSENEEIAASVLEQGLAVPCSEHAPVHTGFVTVACHTLA